MTPTFRPRTLLPTLSWITRAAVSVTALLLASPSWATVIVTSSISQLNAETSGSALDQDTLSNVNSLNHAVTSQVFLDSGDGAYAHAHMQVELPPGQFFGVGAAELSLDDAHTGTAAQSYTLLFTLTHTTEFSGLLKFRTGGDANLHAVFDLDLLGAGFSDILTVEDASSDVDVLLTLEPGAYRLISQTFASSTASTGFAFSDLSFNLSYREVDGPPADVPEPVSLALVLAGLLAVGMVRRHA